MIESALQNPKKKQLNHHPRMKAQLLLTVVLLIGLLEARAGPLGAASSDHRTPIKSPADDQGFEVDDVQEKTSFE